MNDLLMFFLQNGGGVGQIPDLGVRISVWFIGMFLLAVGAALIYLRMNELEEGRKPKSTESSDL
jgi:hypothetical protein